MFAGKADHADEVQLAPFGVFIGNAVEELKDSKSVIPLRQSQAQRRRSRSEERRFYPAQVQARPERPDDVVGEIGLLRIPHEANGDDLRTVEEHPADLNALTTVALQGGDKGEREGSARGQISLVLRAEHKNPDQTEEAWDKR